MKSINPYNNKLIKNYKNHTSDDIISIIENSNNDFSLWKKTNIKDRIKLVKKVSKILEKDVDKHAQMITQEMGKPISESRDEILKCIWMIEYYCKNSEEFLKNEYINTDYSKSYISFEPLGVIFGIMPWNFPYWQVFRFIIPTLLAGNTCIIKHAPNVTGCAMLIESLFNNIDNFKNLFKIIVVEEKKVETLITNKNIKAISLTGSDKAGSAVAMLSGKALKKNLLELGGSDPFIVLDDADLKITAKKAILARFFNSGQSCIAAKRFLVHTDVYDEFVAIILKHIKALNVGNPENKDVQIGPLAKKEFASNIDKHVKNSIAKGAKCIIGGKCENAFYEPTLLIDVNETMDVFKNEIFGPVMSICKIYSKSEAIKIANQSDYGLGASIWTKDIEKAKSIASFLETGSVFINEMTKSDPRLPFGGVKKSGYGHELSKYGIKEFVNFKTIVINEN